MATLSEEFVFEYFSQLNPIAYKIQAEINQTIENYEHYWNDLDKREQMTIINEAVIKPEIQLNYHRAKAPTDGDDEGQTIRQYRDIDASLLNYFVAKSELDRPFSYKTKSQQNLFYSFTPGEVDPVTSAVRLPVAKPKNNQMNKSTDSLTCVNFVSLNIKPKKGRAPAVPSKMTTKPPPPPPPTAAPKIKAAAPAIPVSIAAVRLEDESPAVTEAKVSEVKEETTVKDVFPEDSNSNTSLLSPADEVDETEITVSAIVASANDELSTLLEKNGFDFLNNW